MGDSTGAEVTARTGREIGIRARNESAKSKVIGIEMYLLLLFVLCIFAAMDEIDDIKLATFDYGLIRAQEFTYIKLQWAMGMAVLLKQAESQQTPAWQRKGD